MTHGERFMRQAVKLSRSAMGRTAPNPNVGCVIVKNGRVIAAACTADGGRPHAETIALNIAGEHARGSDVYVTLEPCAHHGKTPPCAQSLIDAGVARVIIGAQDPDPRVSGRGIEMLRNAGIEVITGVLEKESRRAQEGFLSVVERGRPFVTLKMATTQDSAIACLDENGLPTKTAITGAQSLAHAHLVRSVHDAILIGANTVHVDDPILTTRLPEYEHMITRIVMDSSLAIDLKSRLANSADIYPLWIVYDPQKSSADKQHQLLDKNVMLISKEDTLLKTLNSFAQKGITRLFVEGGAKIYRSFLEAKAVDLVLWYKSPDTLGGKGYSALAPDDMAMIQSSGAYRLEKNIALGQDFLDIYRATA